MKAEIYNLIILDESGSMCTAKNNTIAGCNETINSIISSQEVNVDVQKHFISIYCFQENQKLPSRYIVKNIPVDRAKHISARDYQPWGGTPLYDAVGSTIADLKAVIGTNRNAIGSVTIITDGYENASEVYTLEKVAKMIEQLKEQGWLFNFIGANIDVKKVSRSLHIDNVMAFESTETGAKEMFDSFNKNRTDYEQRMAEGIRECACRIAPDDDEEEVMREVARKASKGFFRKK